MTGHHSKIHKQIQVLNETPLSQHVMGLFQQESVTPESGLILASLVEWVLESRQSELEPVWADRVSNAVSLAESRNPEALYEHLALPQMWQTQTLLEAGNLSLSNLADYIHLDYEGPIRV